MSNLRFGGRLAASCLALGFFLGATGCVENKATSTRPGPASVIPATYFGMHENDAAGLNPWPLISFGSFRSWDAYEIAWSDLEPSRGVYNWTPLDAYVQALNSRGVTDILYTFGHTPSWAAPADCLPPANNQDMIDFVRAIATHAKGKLKHWETWNEPYFTDFWCGTMSQLVALQNDVYHVVKAIDGTATVHTPVVGISDTPDDCQDSGADAYNVDDFLAANGTSNFDIVDVHLYPDTGGPPPESLGIRIANLNCTLNKYGIGTIPIWNTEFSWRRETDLPNADDQAAYIARAYLYYWSLGVERSYWYAYNNYTWGTIFNGTNLNSAGVAYQQVHDWMVGARMTGPCAVAGGVWTCGLILANGNLGQAVWLDVFSSASTESYTPGATFDKVHDLAGGMTTFSGSVTLSEQPLLLEGAPATAAKASSIGLGDSVTPSRAPQFSAR